MEGIYLTVFVSLINFILGIIIYIRNRKSPVNVSFALTVFSIVCWTIFNHFANQQNDMALLLTRLTIISGHLIAFFLFFFLRSFFNYKFKEVIIYGVELLTATSILLSITPFYAEGVKYIPTGTGVTYGPLIMGYFLTLSLLIILNVFVLVKGYVLAEGTLRSQAKFVLFGIILSLFFATITNLLIPVIYKSQQYSQLGPVFTVFFVSFIFYAIIKHRLMDIRLVVARSLSYAALLLILAVFYATGILGLERIIFPNSSGSISIYQAAFRISLTAIIAFSFQPIKNWVTERTDRIFFKGQYNSEELLSVLSHVLSSSIVLIELIYKVTDILIKEMRVSRSMFVLLENENKIYTTQLNGYKKSIKIEPKDVYILANQPMLILSELEYNSRIKSILDKYDGELSLPLKTDKGLLGVWILGEKNSGESYSQQDYQILEILIPEIAVAIENAKAYEEISAFNKTLKQEIEHATHKLEIQNSELIKTGRQLEDLVNFLPDATFAIDTKGCVIIWNKMMEELTGTTAESIIGKGNRRFAHSFGYKKELTLAEQILQGSLVKNDHYRSIRREGDSLYAEVYFSNLNGNKAFLGAKAAPLYDQDRNVVGAIESLRDISEIKKVEKILRKSNEELRKIDLAKDDFISMASHQLRTPITAIKGYLSMLIEGDAGEVKISQYDFILEAYRASNRMTGLVNDLLNVSRMEAGRFFLEVNEVDIDSIIQEEMKQLEGTIREKGLYFRYKKGKNVPSVSADKTKIRQVIMNFIDNSVYYTRKGGITVELYKEGDGVVFMVSDTGIGVPKNQQSGLFQKFYRADNAKNTRPDGTGLGLFLAKKVIESHSGKIIFKSTEGVGSTFGFKIPIKNMAKKFSVVMPEVSSLGTAISQEATRQNSDLVKKEN